ncbi:Outer membrane protein [Enterobacter ludwigii]|nr:Outer membrane protein [Enterobacter ludwigii]
MIEHQWQNERLQASQAVNLIVQKTLNDWRSKNMISVIIPRQQVISVDESMDITPLIVKELNGAKVKFGKLPEIKLKDKESQKPLASVQSK